MKLSLIEYAILEAIVKRTPLHIDIDYLNYHIIIHKDYKITIKGYWYYYVVKNLIIRMNRGKDFFEDDIETMEAIHGLANKKLTEIIYRI